MDYKEYKKSYKGFLIFIFLHFSTLIGASLLSIWKDFLPLLLIANIITIGMSILMYIMFVTENIYWMNGIEYEKALLAGSERRKAYALKHFKTLGKAALFGLILTIISVIFNWNQFVVFPIIFITFIIACISTVRFKL